CRPPARSPVSSPGSAPASPAPPCCWVRARRPARRSWWRRARPRPPPCRSGRGRPLPSGPPAPGAVP
ncbi:MAG: hypothetical protein AVDCRST_MAG40-3380, partial [uncultured Gemmatimonadaceae bacterium]